MYVWEDDKPNPLLGERHELPLTPESKQTQAIPSTGRLPQPHPTDVRAVSTLPHSPAAPMGDE